MGWAWIVGALVGWWLAGSFINAPLDALLIPALATTRALSKARAGYSYG
jgi:hypothetical protein